MAALWLAGCANMQGIDTQAQLRDAPSLGLAAPSESLTPAPDWWAALGDPQLNRLVADIDALDHLYLRLVTPLITALLTLGVLLLSLGRALACIGH